MSTQYNLKSLIAELDKLKSDYDNKYDPAINESMFLGIVPNPSKGSALSKFRNNVLNKIVKSRNPLAVSKDLKRFTGSVVDPISYNKDYLTEWLKYIDEYQTPEDQEYLEWRGLAGKPLKDTVGKMSDANKTMAVLDTAYGNNEILEDLRDEAETTDKGGIGSVLKRLPSYVLNALLFGTIGGGIGTSMGEDGIKYGAGGGAALGILINYIRRKNKYGGAANV